MIAKADGYIADIAYPGMFHRETSPLWLRAIVAAVGQQAPPAGGAFRYLDLGCGIGLSTALLAAANPQGEFVGVDINPRHIAQARHFADMLPNLSFVEGSFDHIADMVGDRASDQAGGTVAGAFDYIVVHGAYSWVSPTAQAAIRRIVADRLTPDGIAYIHYTSHPGQSVFAGAQAMLRRIADLTPQVSAAGLANGLACLAALERGGAAYLHTHPAIGSMLLREKADAAYLAHDLLARDWAALHVGDVIAAMEEACFSFVGSANMLDNVDSLSLPEAVVPLMARIGDIKARETARDIARNQSVRRDLYRRRLMGVTPDVYHAQIDALRYRALPAMQVQGDLDIATRIGPVGVSGGMVDPIRARLAQGAACFAELAAAHPFGASRGAILQAVLMLVQAGEIHMAPEISGAGDLSAAWRFNRWLVEQPDFSGWLAAPAIGSAIPVNPLERACALCLLDRPDLSGAALHDAIRRHGALCDDDRFPHLEKHVVPQWRAIGVLPPA